MSNKFKIGDKVRCIDDEGSQKELASGKEYVVEKYDPQLNHHRGGVKVNGSNFSGWDTERFWLITSPQPNQPVQQLSRECKCGIYRNDCTYHQDVP